MSSSGDSELDAQATDFADKLTKTFRGIREDAPAFAPQLRKSSSLWVTSFADDETQQPIILTINGQDRIRIDV